MSWVIRKLGGALVAGVGWKLGNDLYDYCKERFQEATGKKKEGQEEKKEESTEHPPEGVASRKGR